MFTKAFLLATLERAIKTFAQALGAILVGTAAGIIGTDWLGAINLAAMAAVLSILTSVASGRTGEPGPSLGTETLTEKVAAIEAHPAARAEYQAGPAAHVPEGTAVQVIPDEPLGIMRHDRPADTSADTKAEAAYHDPYPGDDLDTKH